MTKDLVSRVLSIVVLAGIFGWIMFDQQTLDIKNMESMTIHEISEKAKTPALSNRAESIGIFVALGITIVILTELLGFFIRVIFFRNIEEANIIHNHNITLQIPYPDETSRNTEERMETLFN